MGASTGKEKPISMEVKIVPMTDPISLFPETSANLISERNKLTSEEAFCFCSVRVQLWQCSQVQCNNFGVSEVLKIPYLDKYPLNVLSGTVVRH